MVVDLFGPLASSEQLARLVTPIAEVTSGLKNLDRLGSLRERMALLQAATLWHEHLPLESFEAISRLKGTNPLERSITAHLLVRAHRVQDGKALIRGAMRSSMRAAMVDAMVLLLERRCTYD